MNERRQEGETTGRDEAGRTGLPSGVWLTGLILVLFALTLGLRLLD